jgi:hypothetical protein
MGSFCHCCNLPRFNFRCGPPDSLSGSAPSASKLWQQLDFALNRKSIVVDCCDLDQESRVFSVCCAHSVESRIFISIPDSLPSLIPCHGIFHHLRVDDGLEGAVPKMTYLPFISILGPFGGNQLIVALNAICPEARTTFGCYHPHNDSPLSFRRSARR